MRERKRDKAEGEGRKNENYLTDNAKKFFFDVVEARTSKGVTLE